MALPGCWVRAVLRELQVRADEDAGAASQDLEQTAFPSLAGLRGSDTTRGLVVH